MHELFNGTPVTVEGEQDGAMLVEVPIRFAFDGEASTVKPPLAAVLDRVALSLKRHPTARVQLAPPGSAAAARVAAMKAHLRTRGVPAHRMIRASAKRDEVVAMRVLPGAQGIDRLEDPTPAASGTPQETP